MRIPLCRNRQGWRDYYQQRFNKTQSAQAAILAMWYDFLFIALGED